MPVRPSALLGVHSCQTRSLLRRAQRQAAFEPQGLVGEVEHADAWRRQCVDQRDPIRPATGRAGWMGRSTRPGRRRAAGTASKPQAPAAAQVVAVAVRRHPDAAAAPLRGRGRDAADELARARGDHDAFGIDAVEAGQRFAQRGVARVGIAAGIRLLQRRQRRRAWAAGVARWWRSHAAPRRGHRARRAAVVVEGRHARRAAMQRSTPMRQAAISHDGPRRQRCGALRVAPRRLAPAAFKT